MPERPNERYLIVDRVMKSFFVPLLIAIAVLGPSCADGQSQDGRRTPSPASTPRRTPSPAASPSPTPQRALGLADVFPPRDLSVLGLDPSRLRVLIATGDVIPARYTDVTIRNRGDDFLYPVVATRDITSTGDITLINLEAPLIASCPYHDSGFVFCGRPGFTAALQAAGVDVVTLENNHTGNYGAAGIDETIAHLDAADIAWADRTSAAMIGVRGLTFGFLAFNGVGEAIDRKAMAAQIAALRPQVDVLTVSFHWGAEYVSLPQAAGGVAPDDPIEIAHLAVDNGADLIIGNHPHWVQAAELYKGKFIAYAHGNFIFDQMWSYETRVSVIGRYTFYDDTLVGVEFVPTLIEDYAQPGPMAGAEAQAVLDGMKAASEQLAARRSPAPSSAP